jgi:hypothetical protein
MMDDRSINPGRVTKPIQLLAAWLAGLTFINGSFLGAATQISRPEWAAGLLVIAAVINVPVFLVCLFLLQTKFRPEMQEDAYYARYLERRYSPETEKTEVVEIRVAKEIDQSVEPRLERSSLKPRLDFKDRDRIVALNSLLPNYLGIQDELQEKGIMIDEVFGKNGQETPSFFLLTIRTDADFELFRKILPVASKHGLQAISVSNDSKMQIYLGSYSYKTRPYLRTNRQVLEVLEAPDTNMDTLKQLLSGPDVVQPKGG